jgi:hypothetical protein
MNGVPTSKLEAGAMGSDQGTGGTLVSQRLISEEPMSIILNLGISRMSLFSLISNPIMLTVF